MKKSAIAEKQKIQFFTADYNRTVLENGIRVVSESIPYVKSISLGVWINVGSRDEDEANNGITHFIEHMVFKGTKKRNAREIAEFVEDIGGYLNAFTTKENTCFYVRILSEHLKEGVEILSDMIQNPVFDKKEIEKEKGVVFEEIKDIEDDLEEYIGDLLEYYIYYPHPLGFPIIGTKETVKAFTQEKLFEHLKKFYNPNNIVISAAGNLVHDELVRYVDRFFNSRSTNGFYYKREKPDKVRVVNHTVEKATNQSHICIGTATYGAKDSKRDHLLLLNTILGDGMSSRLFQNIREKQGLVYSIYSFYAMFKDSGVFGVYFACDKKNVDKTIEYVWKEFDSVVKGGIRLDELKRAKAQVKSSLLIGLESLSNRMQRLAQIEFFYDGKYTDINEIIRGIEAISSDEVCEVANEVLNKERFTTIIINPAKNNMEKTYDSRRSKRN